MGSDYYSLVAPFYHAPVIPVYNGYHMYSYALDMMSVDPTGSTNWGKLTNVSIIPNASVDAKARSEPKNGKLVAQEGSTALKHERPQTFQFVVSAVNNNVIRISGGALGFPVL